MIELRNVTIRAGQFSLSKVRMKVEQGEHAVLMGQTGRGKTTILEAICGLRSVHDGQIIVGNRNVTTWLPGDRGIGYVPQDLALFPTRRVREHLEFALKLRKYGRAAIDSRVKQLADVLGIEKLLDRSIHGLSGGESQRVALGRALSFRPPVLLLDEPFSALDEETREEMYELLKNVTSGPEITTLHVTHSRREAEALANRRFALKDGVVTDVTGAA